jgi:aspartate/methionine/tyrosine aminotransferase
MGCSSSHVSKDKADLELAYAEEGRFPPRNETAKQRVRRERAEKTVRRRRERILAKHRRKAIECFKNEDLGVYLSANSKPTVTDHQQDLIRHMDYLLYEKKIAKKMRKKNKKQRKSHDDRVRCTLIG